MEIEQRPSTIVGHRRSDQIGRRRAIRGIAVASGAAWIAPAVIGVSHAAAQGSIPANCSPVARKRVPFESGGWRYLQVASGAPGGGFEQPGYDDSGFATGTAPFGTYGPESEEVCADQGEPRPRSVTHWDIHSDLLLRRFVAISTTINIEIEIRLDNSADLYWDGVHLDHLPNGKICGADHTVTVPEALCVPGTHLLAVRAHDIGGESYFDGQVVSDECQRIEP